jgi:hypothetical protein
MYLRLCVSFERRPHERVLIFHEDVAVTWVVIATPSRPGNISVSIASTMDERGGELHPSRQDFNNTHTAYTDWSRRSATMRSPTPAARPCPAKLNLIFAAHKFTEYYKNECHAGKDGGDS